MKNFTSPKLAKIRRDKGGSWRIEFVVDGFDQEFVQYCAGSFSQTFAETLCRIATSRQLDVRTRHIHTVSIKHEG